MNSISGKRETPTSDASAIKSISRDPGENVIVATISATNVAVWVTGVRDRLSL